jgi:hypothetical protein
MEWNWGFRPEVKQFYSIWDEALLECFGMFVWRDPKTFQLVCYSEVVGVANCSDGVALTRTFTANTLQECFKYSTVLYILHYHELVPFSVRCGRCAGVAICYSINGPLRRIVDHKDEIYDDRSEIFVSSMG